MRKNILLVLLSLFLMIPIVIHISINRKNMNIFNNEQFQKRQNYLILNLSLSHKYSCTKIDTNILVENRGMQKFTISNILLDSLSFLLYIPPSFCSSCNEKLLKKLPDILGLFDGKLKLLCFPADVNTVKINTDNVIIDENLLFSKESILPNLKDMHLLIITETGQIKTLFMINNENVEFAIEYFELIEKSL